MTFNSPTRTFILLVTFIPRLNLVAERTDIWLQVKRLAHVAFPNQVLLCLSRIHFTSIYKPTQGHRHTASRLSFVVNVRPDPPLFLHLDERNSRC